MQFKTKIMTFCVKFPFCSIFQHPMILQICCVIYHGKVHLFLYFLMLELCLYLSLFKSYVKFCKNKKYVCKLELCPLHPLLTIKIILRHVILFSVLIFLSLSLSLFLSLSISLSLSFSDFCQRD